MGRYIDSHITNVLELFVARIAAKKQKYLEKYGRKIEFDRIIFGYFDA